MNTMEINLVEIDRIHNELIRRKNLLIDFSKDDYINMDSGERNDITSLFEKGDSPQRPEDIAHLMKVFFTSCFSYSVLRNFLKSKIGKIPDQNILPLCLQTTFSCYDFLDNKNWDPNKLYEIAQNIQKERKYNLKSNIPEDRIISVIINGSQEMSRRLVNGLNNFYRELDAISEKSGNEIWAYVIDFKKDIYNVGPNLICDFIKNIGFEKFVKVDHHFKKEFPTLIGYDSCKKMSDKEHFVLSQELADLVNMSPFHLDKLLYLWGRYKKYEYVR